MHKTTQRSAQRVAQKNLLKIWDFFVFGKLKFTWWKQVKNKVYIHIEYLSC